MKYRIVKRENHYEIEIKKLFFWTTVKDFSCDIFGDAYEYPMEFKTFDDAKEMAESL